jgi:hypothetical protein
MNCTLASARIFPPQASQGWTLTFLERESRYWVTAQAGRKTETLFTQGTQDTWAWAQGASTIRWFTDGERRYGKALWPLASERLSNQGLAATYPFRKVWREGLEVAIKIKDSQGQRRVVWLNVDHPFTPLSPASEVQANHNEANNAALRRRCSAYRRRQNLYAKTTEGLQRSLDVQRLIHNWVRPHWGLQGKTTPAMAMGFTTRPISIAELLNSTGFEALLL